MAAGALSGLVAALETYRGRDRVVSGGGGPVGPCPAPCGRALTGLCLRRSVRSAMAVSWRGGRWPGRRPRRQGCPGASWPCRPS